MSTAPKERRTKQRDAIEAALDRAGRPLSPAEIHAAARRRVATISLATVYRSIKRLEAEGTIGAVQLPGEAPRYELRRAAARHHHHFHCRRCDRVFDVEGCPKGIADLVPPHFRLQAHEILLYGLCDTCEANREAHPG